MHNTTEIEDDEIYESIYMQVVELVEKDNISCGFYKDTANKLKDLYNITKRSDSIAEQSLEDYPLIPMNDIEDEARLLAVRWVENYGTMGFDIQNKHRLASNIMNYAIRHHEKQYKEVERLRAALEKISTMQLNSPAEAEGRFYDCIDIAEKALNKKK